MAVEYKWNNLLNDPLFTGEGKGLSQWFYPKGHPKSTVGSDLGRGIGTFADIGGDLLALPFRGYKNIWDLLKAPSPSAKMPPELELAPQARQQDPSGSMSSFVEGGPQGMGIIEPDIFDLEYLPKNIEGLDKNLKEIVENRKKRGEDVGESESNQESKKWKDEQASRDDQEKGGVLTEGSTGDGTEETSADSFETLFNASMSSYGAAQGQEDTGEKTLEDYKKEFAKATGLDVSGKPDKSNALMALGLALMQNKAGKGFDVGKMLGAVGEAGEKALPAFEKAKQEAKLAAAKAGEYALGKVDEDEAEAKLKAEEMLNRTPYYIIPKGKKDAKGMAKSFAEGQFKRLNKYELNNLVTNQEFNDKFEILDGSLYGDAMTEMLKPPEASDDWNKTPQNISLFEEAPEEFKLDVFYYNPNSGKQGGRPAMGTDYLLDNFKQAESGIQRAENEFADIIAATKAGGGPGTSIGPQFGALVDKAMRAFGVNVGAELNPINKAKAILMKIQATKAADILQETGKTLSDNDRQLVKDIVGRITMASLTGLSEAELLHRLEAVYDLTVGQSRRNLSSARSKLKQFGVTIPSQADYSDQFAETDAIVDSIVG